MAGIELSQDAEELSNKQSSQDTETHENSNLSLEQINDNSSGEQEETTTADSADGKQLQVNIFYSRDNFKPKTEPKQFFLVTVYKVLSLYFQMDIMEEFGATFISLNELWKEIGFEPNECENSSADMVLEMKRVLSNKISTTQEIKSGLNSQIRLANARLHA
jgi:hypothetical protein